MAINGINSTEEIPEVISPTMADFIKLVEANPQLRLPLTNIVQRRLLAEKDAEISILKNNLEPSRSNRAE